MNILEIFADELNKMAMGGQRPGMPSMTPQTGAPPPPQPTPLAAAGSRIPLPRTGATPGAAVRPMAGTAGTAFGAASKTAMPGLRM